MTPKVLQIRDFRLLFTTRLFSTMSLQTQAVIVGWQIYQIRPDALLLGLVGLAEAGPAIAGAFFSGHMVDVYRPASVFRLSLFVLFANTCLLWLAAANFIPLSEVQRLFLLFLGVFISGAARSCTTPAIFSMIPKVVPRPLLSSAVAWNSSCYQFAAIIAPAIGGLIYGIYGAMAAFALPPVFMLMALGSVGFLSTEAKNIRNTTVREPFRQSLVAGIKFTLHHRVLMSAMMLDMFSVLFGGAVAVLPIFSDKILHTGSFGLGLLRSAPSIGSAIIALYMAIFPPKFTSGKVLLWVVAGFGVSTIFFALSQNFILSFLLLVATGLFDGVSMVIRSTILQLLTPENMRGRISALSSVFITSSNEIGAFESGLAARLLGLVPSVVIGGIITLGVVCGVSVVAPELRKTKIDRDEKGSV